MKVLCIGLGAIGLPVANALANLQHQVVGVSTTAKPHLHPSATHIQADILTTDLYELLMPFDYQWDCVIVILTPSQGNYSAAGYEQAYVKTAEVICHTFKRLTHNRQGDGLKMPRVLFISSTSVYGENQGGWCDENTAANPTRTNGKTILAAETLYRDAFLNQATIIRPSGIYGLTRLRLLKLLDKQQPVLMQHWSNRIFDDDLVAIIVRIAQLTKPEPLYIATDTSPVYQANIIDFLAKERDKSPVFKAQRHETGKRLKSLYIDENWLTFPTWKHGYNAILSHLHQENGSES